MHPSNSHRTPQTKYKSVISFTDKNGNLAKLAKKGLDTMGEAADHINKTIRTIDIDTEVSITIKPYKS